MTISNQNNYSQAKIQDGRPYKMVIFGISIIVWHVSGPLPPCTPHDPLKPTFFAVFLCSFRWNMLPLSKIRHKKPKYSKWPLSKMLFLMKSYIFCYNYATKVSNTSIPMFYGMLNAVGYSKSDNSEYIHDKIQDGCQNQCFLQLFWYIHVISLTYQWVPQYVTHWSFSSHLPLFNTRGLCRLLRHRLPSSSQLFINHSSVRWIVICQLRLDAHLPERGNLYSHCAPYKAEGIQECHLSILYLVILVVKITVTMMTHLMMNQTLKLHSPPMIMIIIIEHFFTHKLRFYMKVT